MIINQCIMRSFLAQDFVVQLDSLSGDFWVVGKDCFSRYCREEYDSYLKHLYDWT